MCVSISKWFYFDAYVCVCFTIEYEFGNKFGYPQCVNTFIAVLLNTREYNANIAASIKQWSCKGYLRTGSIMFKVASWSHDIETLSVLQAPCGKGQVRASDVELWCSLCCYSVVKLLKIQSSYQWCQTPIFYYIKPNKKVKIVSMIKGSTLPHARNLTWQMKKRQTW